MTVVLGINAFHGDASAVAVRDCALVGAVAEERLNRVKHWAGFPRKSIEWATRIATGGDWGAVNALAVARQPRAHFARKIALALTHWRSIPRAIRRFGNLKAVRSLSDVVAAEFGLEPSRCPPVHAVEHHVAHVASAFLCSPFEEAACLTVDGFGDFVSTMIAVGRDRTIRPVARTYFPHSIGLFYTALTQYLGFPHYGDEYKIMGLAAYGEPSFVTKLESVLVRRSAGRFALDLRYFRHLCEGVDMTWEGGLPVVGTIWTPLLEELLGPARDPRDELTQRHKDVAASVQAVYERMLIHLVRHTIEVTGIEDLCLAGGCGQNSLANGRVRADGGVRSLFVQPAAGDDGTALGAALHVAYAIEDRPRAFVMEHAAWGPEFDEMTVRKALADRIPALEGRDGRSGEFDICTVRLEATLLDETAKALADGEVVGWYQGRGEWGPRALGQRSILADPRNAGVREVLNVRIKRREPFRPFAPSLPAECIDDWFVGATPDPFMTQVYAVRQERRDRVPAIVHADGTGRLHAVRRDVSPRYWGLLRAFERHSGVPILVNTSFNESEPIVNEPGEALDCFLRTRMDRLVMGDVVVRRVSDS